MVKYGQNKQNPFIPNVMLCGNVGGRCGYYRAR